MIEAETPKTAKPGAMTAPAIRPDDDNHGWALSRGEQRRQVRWGWGRRVSFEATWPRQARRLRLTNRRTLAARPVVIAHWAGEARPTSGHPS